MKLVSLEIRNYRSIEEASIAFDGLDCLVGKNNAGKSNILKAIRYLFGKEKVSTDLYHGRNTSLDIDVRGYFQVEDSDFELLKIEEKRERMKEQILDDGTIGICRRSSSDDLEVIGLYPKEERLRKGSFGKFHEEAWDKRDDEDFKDTMLSKYPELEEFLTEGKESNKGEWPDAYERFIRARPEGIEFIKLPAPPPTGISADLKNMLPRPIFVPAVKEVSDVTKTTKSKELGGGLLNVLSSEVQEELDKEINKAMAEVHKRLNVVREEGEILDERHPGVRSIEGQITRYMSETFEDISVSLEFPNPESKIMFDNARVWIDEQDFGRFSVDYTGEGVKRVLILSLLRTLADLRQGRLSVKEDEENKQEKPKKQRQSLLILCEEPELFIHPGLQKILLKAFYNLVESGYQVIFSTHSPFTLQSSLLSSINLVSKEKEAGTQVLDFRKELCKKKTKHQNRLLEIQNVSSYIFADKVLLVEGISDRIVLKKLASALNPEWDFEQNGIPVLSVAGKNNLPLFQDFLTALGIETFVLTDIDSIEDLVPELSKNDNVKQVRDRLWQKVQKLVEGSKFTPKINSDYVTDFVESYEWNEVFEKLEQLHEALKEGNEPKEEQICSLKRLLKRKEEKAWKKAIKSTDVERLRRELTKLLLDQNVLLLNGKIEDYYPYGGGNKVKAALEFNPESLSKDNLRSHFTLLSDGETTDMEEFLNRLFSA